VLGRNTTETLKICLGFIALKPGDEVLSTNLEYDPSVDAFLFDADFCETARPGAGYSFPAYGIKHNDASSKIPRQRTGVIVRRLDILDSKGVLGQAALKKQILDAITPQTRAVFLSHVLRSDGTVLNISAISAMLKAAHPELAIIIDGAQALGNLPCLDVESLGVDIYVAAAHKALASHVLGLGYIHKRLLENSARWQGAASLFRRGMIHPSISHLSAEKALSLPELVSFNLVVELLSSKQYLQGNSFNKLDCLRQKLRTNFVDKLRQVRYLNSTKELSPVMLSPSGAEGSSFILSFRFPGIDNRTVVKTLWEEFGVLSSYLATPDCIRVSFGLSNTDHDIDKFFSALGSIRTGELPRFYRASAVNQGLRAARRFLPRKCSSAAGVNKYVW
jgi:selenocysteine lyase/cysteine desulfurase